MASGIPSGNTPPVSGPSSFKFPTAQDLLKMKPETTLKVAGVAIAVLCLFVPSVVVDPCTSLGAYFLTSLLVPKRHLVAAADKASQLWVDNAPKRNMFYAGLAICAMLIPSTSAIAAGVAFAAYLAKNPSTEASLKSAAASVSNA